MSQVAVYYIIKITLAAEIGRLCTVVRRDDSSVRRSARWGSESRSSSCISNIREIKRQVPGILTLLINYENRTLSTHKRKDNIITEDREKKQKKQLENQLKINM